MRRKLEAREAVQEAGMVVLDEYSTGVEEDFEKNKYSSQYRGKDIGSFPVSSDPPPLMGSSWSKPDVRNRLGNRFSSNQGGYRGGYQQGGYGGGRQGGYSNNFEILKDEFNGISQLGTPNAKTVCKWYAKNGICKRYKSVCPHAHVDP